MLLIIVQQFLQQLNILSLSNEICWLIDVAVASWPLWVAVVWHQKNVHLLRCGNCQESVLEHQKRGKSSIKQNTCLDLRLCRCCLLGICLLANLVGMGVIGGSSP